MAGHSNVRRSMGDDLLHVQPYSWNSHLNSSYSGMNEVAERIACQEFLAGHKLFGVGDLTRHVPQIRTPMRQIYRKPLSLRMKVLLILKDLGIDLYQRNEKVDHWKAYKTFLGRYPRCHVGVYGLCGSGMTNFAERFDLVSDLMVG